MGRKGQIAWNKGKHGVYTKDTLRHMSESRMSPVSTEQIIELYKSGLSCNQIARELNSNYAVVWRRLVPTRLLRDRGIANRGKKLSESTRKVMSEAQRKIHNTKYFKESYLYGEHNPFFGHKHKPETIEAMKAKLKGMMAGDKNPQWKGGKSLEPYGYKFKRIVRHQVYKRDNYTCQTCGVKHEPRLGLLVAHHKDEDKNNCSLDNLITLCRPCHGKITMGARWSKEVIKIQ